jgi:SAM-dependent methyltransferase
MIDSLRHYISRNPCFWDALRRFLEGRTTDEADAILDLYRENPGEWLDIGCGIGRFTSLFPRRYYLGTEIDRDRLDIARRRHPEFRFSTQLPRELEAEGRKFAGILLSHILHHLSDEEIAPLLETCGSLLLPSGVIAIIEWHPPSPEAGWFHNFCHTLEPHRNVRTPNGWGDLLTRHGFTEINVRRLKNPRHVFHLITGKKTAIGA